MQMLAQGSSAAVASSKLDMPLPLCPKGIKHKTIYHQGNGLSYLLRYPLIFLLLPMSDKWVVCFLYRAPKQSPCRQSPRFVLTSEHQEEGEGWLLSWEAFWDAGPLCVFAHIHSLSLNTNFKSRRSAKGWPLFKVTLLKQIWSKNKLLE